MNSKSAKFFTVLTFVGLYLLSTGLSFAVFDYLKKPLELTGTTKVAPETKEALLVDNSGPKTEACPLNGQKLTKAEKDVWSTRRPLAVMIENHEEARPQSGLSSADVIYEAVAEGGITRFMAVFYCNAIAKESIVGPVRSARTYFLDWASEYGETPLYTHVGGAHCDEASGEGCSGGAKADALGQINKYGWEGENDLNQFSIGYPTFWRDYERIGHTVATEHTMYSTTERLWAVGKKREWTNKDPEGNDWKASFTAWSFKDDDKTKGEGKPIEFYFWEDYNDYKVKWEYDKENNVYKRSNGDKPHLDLNSNQQLSVKNVVIQLAKESSANDGYANNLHLLYGTIGEGKATIFQDGKVIEGKWVKKSRTDRTKFYDSKGKEIKFNAGQIWIEVLPLEAKVTY
jgi:hypothetical protein